MSVNDIIQLLDNEEKVEIIWDYLLTDETFQTFLHNRFNTVEMFHVGDVVLFENKLYRVHKINSNGNLITRYIAHNPDSIEGKTFDKTEDIVFTCYIYEGEDKYNKMYGYPDENTKINPKSCTIVREVILFEKPFFFRNGKQRKSPALIIAATKDQIPANAIRQKVIPIKAPIKYV